MCGISAVIDRGRSADSMERLLAMHAQIRHRGPDGEGFLVIDPMLTARRVKSVGELAPLPIAAGMAFRRLNVLDLSEEASQPMGSADGAYWLVFNGEIYNFRELRDRLRAEGWTFRTHSDTEVVLAAWEAWGSKCFDQLDGMWAIVVFDLRRRIAVISRDRFAIKPLYWSIDGDRLLLGSEIKQILAGRSDRPVANHSLVATYLRGNRIPVLDDTFFRNVQAVPTSSFVEVPLDGTGFSLRPVTYWDFGSIEPRSIPEREYRRTVDEFEQVLRRAVATHNVADVRVGYLLSGGLDSSTLAALMADTARAEGGTPAPTFSFGFREKAPRFCELHYADAVARRHCLVNHETTFDSEWIVANAGRVMRAIEEPVLGIPALAQYRVFELCAQHGMTVVLDGEGSDEVLGGYPTYQANYLVDLARHGSLMAFQRELRAMAQRQGQSSVSFLYHLFIRPRLARRRLQAPDLFDAAYGARSSVEGEAVRSALADVGRQTSRVGRRLFRDVKWGNVKLVLGYTDRTSMAHSIEARVPYLDRALVEMAFSLPDAFKVGSGDRKRILRDVARRHLPPEVTERKDRMGFGTPDAMLIRGAMWNDVESRITDPSFAGASPFVPGSTRRFLERFRRGEHDDVRTVWRLYALARWSEEFGIDLRA